MRRRKHSLHSRLKKLEYHARGERKVSTKVITVATLADGTVFADSILDGIGQGAGSASRLGDEITVAAIEFAGCPAGIVTGTGAASSRAIDMYLCRPNDPNDEPEYVQFQSCPGGKYDAQHGWEILHHLSGGSDDKAFYSINSAKRFKPHMRVIFDGTTNIVKNNVYLVLKNDTGGSATDIQLAFKIHYYDK